MLVDIETLEKATLAVFQHFRELGISSVNVNKDFYWHISAAERYNLHKDPTNLTLGQLSDDWEKTKSILSEDMDYLLNYNFVWIASLLLYIGENIPEDYADTVEQNRY